MDAADEIRPVINNSLDKRQRLNSFYTMLSVRVSLLYYANAPNPNPNPILDTL